MGFQLSPGVNITEIDLTTIIPAVATSIGAIAGPFAWGPANKPMLIDSELTLVSTFGMPDNSCANNWFTAANFLSYANALQTVRVVKSGAGGHMNATASGTGVLIPNEDFYLNNFGLGESTTNGMFAAKYPGSLGNSIGVAVADADSFGGWPYKANFPGAPNTSTMVASAGGLNDEIHVIVVDTLGSWTGVPGEVLERFSYLSKCPFAQYEDGSTMYYPEVLNRQSKYIWWMQHPTATDLGLDAPTDNWGGDLTTTFDTTATKIAVDAVTGTFTAGETIADATGATVSSGSGAILGTPVIGAGGILAIPVSAAGSGYLVPPNVVITGDGDQNARAVAVLGTGGTATHVVSITVTVAGANNTAATAVITSGSGATASVTIGGVGGTQVTGFTSLVGGSNYTSVPTVVISGDGSSAVAHAVLTSGVVTSIIVDTPGTGYTSATVAITAVGSGATAGTITFNTGKIISIGVTAGGSGYTDAPTVSITGNGSSAAATTTITSGVVTSVTVTNGGSGYSGSPVATAVPVGSGATASVTVNAAGRIIALTPTAIGSGYNSVPAVIISGPGTGAVITPQVVSHQITNYVVTNGGSGYSTLSAQVISYGSSVIDVAPIYGSFVDGQTVTGLTSGAVGTITDIEGGPLFESLTGGVDGNLLLEDGEYINGFDLFASAEDIDVSLILTADADATVQIYVINDIAEFRLDCVAFISPPKDLVVDNAGNEAADITVYRDSLPNSSYAVMDSGWKYQYDKYADLYRWVPLNGDIAGLCARTDSQRDPWWSPAGFNRGNINNVVRLAWNPRLAYRDLLYQAGVNPVITTPGLGTVLFGDKTMLTKPSAFDRINVRRLFIVIEKAIATASKFTLFEFNDQFTRAQFVNMVEPYLSDVQGRRGIFDYRVVCDDTNNTPDVIDSNQFIGDIYVKPARSINFIQLNFIAVRTGVDFTEVVGKF